MQKSIILDAEVKFGNNSELRTVKFRGKTAADIVQYVKDGVEVVNRRTGRKSITSHINGGTDYGSTVYETSVTFRDQTPKILRKDLFIGTGFFHFLCMKILCDRITQEAVPMSQLLQEVNEVTNGRGNVTIINKPKPKTIEIGGHLQI